MPGRVHGVGARHVFAIDAARSGAHEDRTGRIEIIGRSRCVTACTCGGLNNQCPVGDGGVWLPDGREQALVFISIDAADSEHAAKIGETHHSAAGFTRTSERGEEDGQEKRDDSDHDEDFDEREASLGKGSQICPKK